MRQLVVIITALLIPILPFVIIGELPGERWLSAVDDNALLFGLTGSGLLALDIFLPIPSSILGTILGARLGFWPGTLCTWTGLVAGNLLGFAVARFASGRFRSWMPAFPKTTTQALVFLSRPVPIVAEAVSFAAGATRMPVLHFFLLSAAGNAIYAVVLCGSAAAFVPDALVGPGLVVPMLLPVLAWGGWHAMSRQRGTAE